MRNELYKTTEVVAYKSGGMRYNGSEANMRHHRLWMLPIATVIAVIFGAAASARPPQGAAERALLEAANRDRAAAGLQPLRWNDSLAAAARLHVDQMARRNALSHQFSGEPGLKQRIAAQGGSFVSIAENVAEGPSPPAIHDEWMNSPPHRANLLDRQLDSVGIAVVGRNGTLFAVEDFSLAGVTLSLRDQEKLVADQLQSRGLRLLSYQDDARKTCAMDNGFAGSHEPSFVVHYATAELGELPEMLRQRIATGKYHSAAVGACPAGKRKLAGYRVAVMLYEEN
jgi:uncharacterized protein YkwD